MKIILFGSNGMLGTYLKKYFSPKYRTVCLGRENIDLNSSEDDIYDFIKGIVDPDDIIINAAGVIHQRNPRPEEMVNVNAAFPHILQNIKNDVGCQVFHITTDCVFSGQPENNDGGLLTYNENSYHDASDLYGRSKSLGEAPKLSIIRTSIIGEEVSNKLSLLEWAKSKAGELVFGYVDHLWNGVTCHELCILIDKFITDKFFWEGVRHFNSPDYVNKFTLLKMISDIYDLKLEIRPTTKESCSRVLTSIYSDYRVEKGIEQQIRELKEINIYE